MKLACFEEGQCRDLVAGEGFIFAVEMYGLFSRTASTAVSDMSAVSDYIKFVFFTVKLTKPSKKSIAEILRNKHSIFMLLTVTFSRGKNFDQGTF